MPRLPFNAEPSAFRRGVYVVYDGDGYVWHASKSDREWVAKPGPSNPALSLAKRFSARTLRDLSHVVLTRPRSQRVTPF